MARKNPPGSVPEEPDHLERLTPDQETKIEEYREQISMELENYSRYAQISDWKKCKPLEWRGFCIHVGKTVFRDRSALKEKVRESTSCTVTNNNAYDLPMLSALFDLYKDLCYSVPGLPCRPFDFQEFVGVGHGTFRILVERVTPSGLSLAQKFAQEQEFSIAMAGEGGRINPTMALAWNNHFHGWTQSREIIHRDGGQILDGGQWSSKFLAEKSEKPIIEGEKEGGEVVKLPESTE